MDITCKPFAFYPQILHGHRTACSRKPSIALRWRSLPRLINAPKKITAIPATIARLISIFFQFLQFLVTLYYWLSLHYCDSISDLCFLSIELLLLDGDQSHSLMLWQETNPIIQAVARKVLIQAVAVQVQEDALE
jgi:hypothetical protein